MKCGLLDYDNGWVLITAGSGHPYLRIRILFKNTPEYQSHEAHSRYQPVPVLRGSAERMTLVVVESRYLGVAQWATYEPPPSDACLMARLGRRQMLVFLQFLRAVLGP